jgi:hypothetical protein
VSSTFCAKAEVIQSFSEADSSQLKVRETNPHRDPRWESFVMQHSAATVYHHPAWLATLEREYRQSCVYLVCEDTAGVLHGVFPMMLTKGVPFRKRHPLMGRRLVSLPRTPLGGPLTTGICATELLLKEAVRRVSETPGIYLQIKSQEVHLRGLVDGIAAKPWRLTYRLHLSDQSSEPFRVANNRTWSGIKRAINKATANGLRVRQADTVDDLAVWYRCYLETMRRTVVPARPYRFFLGLWEYMRPKGLMRLLLAERETASGTRIVGGFIFFYLGQTATYAFGASRTSDLEFRPNDMILLHAIIDAQRDGFRVVDLGEVPEGDEGLVRFKVKWGAEPERLCRYYYPDFPDDTLATEGSGSPLTEAAKRLWQQLPLGITSWIGDRIYSRL